MSEACPEGCPDCNEEGIHLGVTKEIFAFIHCGRCLKELQAGEAGTLSPREYASLEIGWTKQGLQVWCSRHEMNVMHVHFEGCKHPARSDAVPPVGRCCEDGLQPEAMSRGH